MTVYVDEAKNAYGRMKMCHMLADTLDELHAMASLLGLRWEWFQRESTPHYDICQARRAKAIQLGAQVASREKVVELIRLYRSQRQGSEYSAQGAERTEALEITEEGRVVNTKLNTP